MVTRIALVGDERNHPSHRELNAVRGMLGDDVVADWVATDGAQVRDLSGFDGIWLVPGSPYFDEAAVYAAIRTAREDDVPFLGTCGGLQYAVIEFFRNVLGAADASHAESDGLAESSVVVPLSCNLQGQQRQVHPVTGTRFAALVGEEAFVGMHYCSYAPSAEAIDKLVSAGMVLGATGEDAGAEVLELPANRFYMLSLFQPHIGALAGKPLHPLLGEFVRCADAHALIAGRALG